ncbi:hypothetical protein CC2G_005448 [Coprinopsis cinerea AmutBmut pab1-1]|nr:hypothetical protein CC2G_005448 [Coprinopsis cinerea AmutBmut pab1-1]
MQEAGHSKFNALKRSVRGVFSSLDWNILILLPFNLIDRELRFGFRRLISNFETGFPTFCAFSRLCRFPGNFPHHETDVAIIYPIDIVSPGRNTHVRRHTPRAGVV